jgi:hypothetical protein
MYIKRKSYRRSDSNLELEVEGGGEEKRRRDEIFLGDMFWG